MNERDRVRIRYRDIDVEDVDGNGAISTYMWTPLADPTGNPDGEAEVIADAVKITVNDSAGQVLPVDGSGTLDYHAFGCGYWFYRRLQDQV